MTAERRRAASRVLVREEREPLGGGSLSTVKRFVVGRPLATHAQDTELLPKRIALPVFSSDAVSSTAYGTEVMLTVLVPVAGVAAFGYLVPLSLVLIGVLTLLIVDGLIRSFTGSLHQLPVNHAELNAFTHNGALVTGVTLFALMKAFSSGAVALSGVEAISNGVPAFQKPKSRNAAITLVWTGIFLGGPLLGLAGLTNRLRPTLSMKETLISLLGDQVFGRGSPLYILLMAAAAGILCLSANTSFADFPRLSSVVARDGFLPHQFAKRGDRLVFSNGIIAVALSAIVLLVGFGGKLDSLVPLFAVGLFTAFTLSQVGMVRHHLRHRERGWRRGLAINATGATATSIIFVVILVSKFTAGAWIPAVVIPLIVVACKTIKRHYDAVEQELAVPEHATLPAVHNTVIVPMSAVNKSALDALAYARALHPERLVAVVVDLEDADVDELRRRWRELDFGITLEIVESPYREITRPLLAFINEVDDRRRDDVITVILPELVVRHWWQQLLHNQTALALKGRLLFRPNTIVISVPTQLGAATDGVSGRAPGARRRGPRRA